MMLEQKVKYKNSLKDLITKLSIDEAVCEKINLIDQIKHQHEFVEYDRLVAGYAELLKKNQSIIDDLNGIVDRLDKEIIEIVNKRHYDSNIDNSITDYVVVDEATESTILNKIASYSQLKYPGLQINCTYLSDPIKWLNAMVANDPFYLSGPVDNVGGLSHLENMILPYPEIYQKRLRLYGIQNRNLDILPQSQFGFILCWNFFNYQTLSTIEIYLSKLIKLLRPGGTLMFSYNNCDLLESARLFDNYQANWATENIIKNICQVFGFEIIQFTNIKTSAISYCSWAEVRRSGELTTVKRSQAQGLIYRK